MAKKEEQINISFLLGGFVLGILFLYLIKKENKTSPPPPAVCPTISPKICPVATTCPSSNVACSPSIIGLCCPPSPVCATRPPCSTSPPATSCPTCPSCPSCPLEFSYNLFFHSKETSSTRKCLDRGSVWSNGYGDFDCQRNNDQQKSYLRFFNDGQFQILDSSKTNCLTAKDPNYSWLFEPCDGNNVNQRFKWVNSGDNRQIESIGKTNKCLDIGNQYKQSDCSSTNKNQSACLLVND